MTVETASHISELNDSYPDKDDDISEGDNHIRQLKTVLLTDFAGIGAPVTATAAELNRCDIATEGTVQASRVLTANGAGNVNFSGNDATNLNHTTGTIGSAVTGTTQTAGTNNDTLATTAYADTTSGVNDSLVAMKSAISTIISQDGLATDADLRHTGIVAGRYKMELFLKLISSPAADFKMDFSTSATLNGSYRWTFIDGTSSALSAGYVPDMFTDTTVAFPTGTTGVLHLVGEIECTLTGANLIFRWAQDNSTAVNTSVDEGSWINISIENS